MKITIIKAATKNAKPQGFCPAGEPRGLRADDDPAAWQPLRSLPWIEFDARAQVVAVGFVGDAAIECLRAVSISKVFLTASIFLLR